MTGLNGRGKLDHYVASFYWTVMIVTTVGLGDVAAASTSERFLSIWVMIFGAAIFTVGTSSMIHLRDQLQWKKRQFAQSMHQLNLYLDEHKISQTLRGEIREHAVAKAQRYALTLTEEQRLLEGLTLELRSKLTLERNLHFLEQVQFMQAHGASAELMRRAIASRLHIAYFGPGDVVVRQGSDADAMFFIVRGAVEVLVALADGVRQRRVAMLSRNQFFGEGAMKGPLAKRNATIRAIMFTEARTLSRADMLDAVGKAEALEKREASQRRASASRSTRRLPSLRTTMRMKVYASRPAPAPAPAAVQRASRAAVDPDGGHPLLQNMNRLRLQREDTNRQLLSHKHEDPLAEPVAPPVVQSPAQNPIVEEPPRTPEKPKASSRAQSPRDRLVQHPLPNLVAQGPLSAAAR